MNSTKVQNPRRNSYAGRTILPMRVKVYAIKSVVYGRNAENEPVSRIKMADYRALVSMGAL